MNRLKLILLTVSTVLAMAFIFSCSDNSSKPQYLFCVYPFEEICVPGPVAECQSGGLPKDECPDGFSKGSSVLSSSGTEGVKKSSSSGGSNPSLNSSSSSGIGGGNSSSSIPSSGGSSSSLGSNSSSSSLSSGTVNSSSSSSVGGGNPTSYPPLTQGSSGVQNGRAVTAWNGCARDCSWKRSVGNGTPCKACSIDGMTEIAVSNATENSCIDDGTAYACFDQTPYVVNDNLAYAFATTFRVDGSSPNGYGECYQLQFIDEAIKGKTLIVIMTTSLGIGVNAPFEIMVPGGGGNPTFTNAFTKQLTYLGISNPPSLGYNGLLGDCELEGGPATHKACLTDKCNATFAGSSTAIQTLREGCLWHADWMQAARQLSSLLYKQVDCPQYLINKYNATLF